MNISHLRDPNSVAIHVSKQDLDVMVAALEYAMLGNRDQTRKARELAAGIKGQIADANKAGAVQANSGHLYPATIPQALREASRALTDLDPLGEKHDSALIDDALTAVDQSVPVLPHLIKALGEATFALESVAHLQGQERQLLPITDKARCILAIANNKPVDPDQAYAMPSELGAVQGPLLSVGQPQLLPLLAKAVTWMETHQRVNNVGETGPLAQDIATMKNALAQARQSGAGDQILIEKAPVLLATLRTAEMALIGFPNPGRVCQSALQQIRELVASLKPKTQPAAAEAVPDLPSGSRGPAGKGQHQ